MKLQPLLWEVLLSCQGTLQCTFCCCVIKVLVYCSLLWLLSPVTLKVCTGIVSISRRGSEEKIIFPRREGTYLTMRCSSSNSIGD